MPELSKTAKASMKYTGDGKKTVDPFDTNEKRIKELRSLRASNLYVNRMDFVDALLAEYDIISLQLDRTHDVVITEGDGLPK